MHALASAPPADLHDEPVDRHARRDDLPAERLPSLDREPVQVALAGERNSAVVDRLQEPPVRRVAGEPVARTCRSRARRALELVEDERVCVRRDEDIERALRRPVRRPPRRAPRSRSSRSRALAAVRVGEPERAPRPRARGGLRRGGAPCASRRRCRVSSFTHTPPAAEKPSASLSSRAPEERA